MLDETTVAPQWPLYPSVFEINTWVWLTELSKREGKSLDLSCVPAYAWDAIGSFGFDAVWLMGVWERSPAGLAIANRNPALLGSFHQALPDFQPADNVGSPYCIRRYIVDAHLGGPYGLEVARKELARRGMRLILDFVPNHVAPDHPWVTEHPEYFIAGSREDLSRDPGSWIEAGDRVLACGRDPYFPAWPDVLQLNAFNPGLRDAASETLLGIAAQADGVRCDMAMLMMNRIFERTWTDRAGRPPETDYWIDTIRAVKKSGPNFLFIAEAYWDLEWELQQQGFDFCYDKRLYDRLEHDNAETVRLHLCADLPYQQRLLRFIENHDEPRAAATLSPAKHRAAAVLTSTLPGARLFHEGQFEGRKTKLPVFLGRRPAEPVDHDLHSFYTTLFDSLRCPIFRDGQWSLCDRSGWPDNQSCQNVVAWSWVGSADRYLIVVNLSDSAAQAQVRVPWEDIRDETLHLVDALSDSTYDRSGADVADSGLYVDLGPWMFHFFHCRRTVQSVPASASRVAA